MIKFKDAGNGNFIRITMGEQGEELSRTASFGPDSKPRTSGAGFYQEYLDYVEKGGVVEPFETPAEIATREAKEAQQAIEDTRSLCIKYLNETEKHVTDDPPYPADVERHKADRAAWRTILKSGETAEVSEPFKGS